MFTTLIRWFSAPTEVENRHILHTVHDPNLNQRVVLSAIFNLLSYKVTAVSFNTSNGNKVSDAFKGLFKMTVSVNRNKTC